ncbi:hypothetical protein Q4R26_17635 [Morganella morganii]|uniref:hypothetical protein n=1 Tax=Morganella morganii TaxID=582 RepID=UPI00191E20FD|nr:hypothetical protein [Morganella morganii]QQU42411.1 hypothetical protein I6I42_08340 [Morganella morganii]
MKIAFLLSERREIKRELERISWNDIIGRMKLTSQLMRVDALLTAMDVEPDDHGLSR